MNDEGRETKEEIIVHRPSHEVAVIIPPSFIETSKAKPKN